jgi:hypothetical protein
VPDTILGEAGAPREHCGKPWQGSVTRPQRHGLRITVSSSTDSPCMNCANHIRRLCCADPRLVRGPSGAPRWLLRHLRDDSFRPRPRRCSSRTTPLSARYLSAPGRKLPYARGRLSAAREFCLRTTRPVDPFASGGRQSVGNADAVARQSTLYPRPPRNCSTTSARSSRSDFPKPAAAMPANGM